MSLSVPATFFTALGCGTTDTDTEIPRRRRTLIRVEQVGLQKIWPSVIEMTFVGMYADVVCLRSMIVAGRSSNRRLRQSDAWQRSSRRECR